MKARRPLADSRATFGTFTRSVKLSISFSWNRAFNQTPVPVAAHDTFFQLTCYVAEQTVDKQVR